MIRTFVRAGLLAAAAVFVFAAVGGTDLLAPGARAEQYKSKSHHARRHARRGEVERDASTPEAIARYFQLYGGYIDPSINKQSQGGPFDSGFFFDSGMGANGGDSPYMN